MIIYDVLAITCTQCHFCNLSVVFFCLLEDSNETDVTTSFLPGAISQPFWQGQVPTVAFGRHI